MLALVAGVLLAVVFYLVLHAVAVRPVAQVTQIGQFGSMAVQLIWQTLAGIRQYLVPALCLIGAAGSAIQRRRRTQLLERTTANPAADALNGRPGEPFDAMHLLSELGFGYSISSRHIKLQRYG